MNKTIKKEDNFINFVRGSGWFIYRWQYMDAECLTTKPQMESSYIQTPTTHSNP